MRAQGLPVNMIVLTGLGLLALVVVGAFFITGFGTASESVNVIEADQADCQSLCQNINMLGTNYADCASLSTNRQVYNYGPCALQYGDCRVTIRAGRTCSCGPVGCAGSPQELCSQLCGGVSGASCAEMSGEYFTYCNVPTHNCLPGSGCTAPDFCSCNPSGCTCVTPPS